MNLQYGSNKKTIYSRIKSLITFVLFLSFWHCVTSFSFIALSSPLAVGRAFVHSLFSAEPIMGRTLIAHATMSFARICVGGGCAFILAICFGIFFGCYKNVREFGTILIEVIRPIPPLAWVPVSMVLFGMHGHFFIVFIGAFFPCFSCVYEGVRSVDREWVDLGNISQATDFQIISKIIIPAALPNIINGVRIGLGVAWMCIIAAEMISFSSAGLGYYIMVMHDIGQTTNMLAGMVMIGIIGFLISKFFSKITECCSYVR